MKDKEKLKHVSNSDVQIEIEAKAIQLLSKELNIKFTGYTFNYGEAKLRVDLYSDDNNEIIIGEVYAGIKELKAGQKKKIASDFLKLITIEKIFYAGSKIRKIFIVIDKDIFTELNNENTWLAQSAKIFCIEIRKITLSKELNDKIQYIKGIQGENFKNK